MRNQDYQQKNFADRKWKFFSARVGEGCCWSLVKAKRLLISRLRVFRTDIHQSVYLYFAFIISSWQSSKLLHPLDASEVIE